MTRQTRFSRLALMVTFVVAWTLAGCTVPTTIATETITPTTVNVYLPAFLGSAPVYIAQTEGYFADQGLKVEFVPLKSSIDAVPSLTQGDIDVAVTSTNVALFNTIARGGPIRLVSGLILLDPKGCPHQGLLGRKDLVVAGELREPSQFRGRRLATGPLGMEGFYIDQYLGRDGLSLADMQVDDIQVSAIGEALAKGSLDAANAAEPWLTRILKDGNAELIVHSKDVIPNTQSSIIAFGPSLLVERPEIGKRFIAAVVRGIHKYQEGKTPANVKTLAQFTGLDPTLIEEVCWPTMSTDGVLRAESLVLFEQWALSKGAVDKVLSPAEFWDSRFTDAVREGNAAR